MSDPNRPVTPHTDPATGEQKTASPMLWILVLIALVALAWYFLWRREAPPEPVPQITAPLGQTETPGDDADSSARTGDTARRQSRSAAAQTPSVPADREAVVLTQIAPDYPRTAARSQEEGMVVVRADIDETGKPVNVEVARRSGSRDLDRAAVDAVRQWTFEPAIRDGKAVVSTVEVPVDFTFDRQ